MRSHSIGLLGISIISISALAATINVPADQATINGAITIAAGGDLIVVAAGTFNEDVNISKTVTVQLNGSVAILSLTGIAGSTVNIQSNNLTISSTTSSTYSGQFSGTGKLTKGGVSTLTLAGNSTVGSVDVNEGTLAVASSTALGMVKIASAAAATLRIDSGTVTASGIQDAGASTLQIGNGTLTVTSGLTVDTLRVGYVTTGVSVAGALVVNGGNVVVGSGTEICDVGRSEGNSSRGSGSTNFAAAASVTVNVADLRIGTLNGSAGPTTGAFTLSAAGANSITATNIHIADSGGAGNTGSESLLTLGRSNTINADMFIVGYRKSKGGVVFAGTGGSLNLRGRNGGGNNCTLRIGYNNIDGTGTVSEGRFETAGNILNAELDECTLGLHNSGAGAGKGTLTISDGTTQVNTLVLSKPNHSGVSTTPANSSATLTQTGGQLRAVTLRSSGGTVAWNWSAGTIRNRDGQNLVNENVPITMLNTSEHAVDIDDSCTGTFQAPSVVSGVGTLLKTGNGTLFLLGTNTYSGNTTFGGGTVSVSSIGANGFNGPLGAGNFIFSTGTLLYTGTGESTNRTTFLGNVANININSGTQLTLTGAISGSAIYDITKLGSGDLYLAAANTFGGWLQVNAGRLICTNNAAIGSHVNTGVQVLAGATLGVQGGVTLGGKAIYLNGTGLGNGGALASLAGNNAVSSPIALGSDCCIVSTAANDVLTLDGNISAYYGLTFGGTGNITVNGVIEGASGLVAGLLETRYHGSFNTSALPGGFLRADLSTRPPANNAKTNAGTPGPWSDEETWVYSGQIYDADGTFSLGEMIDDNVQIKINGVVRLTNTDFDVATNTSSANGLRNNNSSQLNINPQGGTTSFGSGGWFDIEIRLGNSGGGAGPVVFNNWVLTKGFGYSATASTTYDGADYILPIGGLANVDGNLRVSASNSITKAGMGSLTLNAANTYSGPTLVSQGTLVAANTTGSATGTGAVMISNGATISGVGRIGGSLACAGTVSPAGNAGGALAVGGNLTISTGGILLAQIDGAGVSDLLTVDGDVSINTGATLSATAVNTTHGNAFTLINNTGANAVAGTFTGVTDGAALTMGARAFVLRYTLGAADNDIVLIDNVAPILSASSQTIDEGLGLSALNASDPDSDALTFSVASGTLPVGITLNTDGTFSGTAEFAAQGLYTPIIRVTDAVNGFSQATLTVNVVDVGFSVQNASVNEAAGIVVVKVIRSGGGAQSASVDANTANGSALAGQDYTATGAVLKWLAGETGVKTFSIPILNDTVADFGETFAIVLSNPVNAQLSQATGIVQIVDDETLPVANADMVSTGQSRALRIAVMTNDTGLGNSPITVSIVTAPAMGNAEANANGTVTYTPSADYLGPDSFVYRITDSRGQTAQASVAVIVKPPAQITSQPVLSPNPAFAGLPILGSVGIDVGTITWNWGDGTSSSGVTVSHTYATSGIYGVEVTAISAEGLLTTQRLNVFVGLSYDGPGETSDAGGIPGVTGILIGGVGAGSLQGGRGKVLCNYVRPEKTQYSGSLGMLNLPAGMKQEDLTNSACTLRIGKGSSEVILPFDLGKNGKGKATGLPQISFSVKKRKFQFKAQRADLTALTEVLGGPREFMSTSEPVILFVPVTLQIGTKVYLAMTLQVTYKQLSKKGKGILVK